MKSREAIIQKPLMESVRDSFLQSASDANGRLTEHVLCKQHGVSRSAIREVMRHLEHQGLIERKRKTGSRIRKLTVKELVDLWDVRCALEALAARLACNYVSEQDLQGLRELIATRVRAAKRGDLDTVDKLDIEFHERVISISRNVYIRDVIRNLQVFDRIFRIDYSVPSYWPQDENSVFGHNKIIEALARRDADLAEDLMKRHVAGAKKRRIEALIGKLDTFGAKA